MKRFICILVVSVVLLFVAVQGIFYLLNKKHSSFVRCSNVSFIIQYPHLPCIFESNKTEGKFIVLDYPQTILAKAKPFSKDTVYNPLLQFSDKKCRLICDSKDCSNIEEQFSEALIKCCDIEIKKEMVPAYVLETSHFFIDSTQNTEGKFLVDIPSLTANLRFLSGCPICVDDMKQGSFYVDLQMLKMSDIEKLSDLVYDQCGLILSKHPQTRCMQVTYYQHK